MAAQKYNAERAWLCTKTRIGNEHSLGPSRASLADSIDSLKG
ncbi:MAG: hypothetical protein ABIU05_11910 [Nitrospirales bacterium]